MTTVDTLLPTTHPTTNEDFFESDSFNAAFYITLGIIVNLMNLLIIITVLNFRSLGNPDVLILALACVDYISSWILCPLGAYYYLHPSPNFAVICDIYTTASCGLQMFSTAIITLMTMDRFLAIRKPIFYRAKLSVPNLKRLIVVLAVLCIITPCLPLILKSLDVISIPTKTGNNNCFEYHAIFIYILLCWSYIQIPLAVYCYIGFIFYIRQFVNHKSQKSFDSLHSNSTSKKRWYQVFTCRKCRKTEKRPPTRKEILEKTITMMKHVSLKRFTMMASTLAWIVVIYYVVWIVALVSMTYQLITKANIPMLNFVVIRLTLLDSICNPIVCATLNSNYKRGFKWTLYYPLRICGYKKHGRKSALGLTASELKTITQRMAIDEYESPGINRRQYDQHMMRKHKSLVSSGRTNINGCDNQGFDVASPEQINYNAKNGSQNSIKNTGMTHAIVETQRSGGNNPPSSRPPESRERAIVHKIESQATDSGVDVESIQQDGATSNYSSPVTNQKLLTKDRGGSVNSTQSEPPGVKVFNQLITEHNVEKSANHMQSVRIETSKNAWHSDETLVKVHIDVLELLNESAMLGPYCLQSKIKRCKLRSSERPPNLTFSVKENRFVARRTSFDDLDAYYMDFSKPIIDQIASSLPKGKTDKENEPGKNDKARKLKTTGLEGPWNSRSLSSSQDDLIVYSQLLLQKHVEDAQKHTKDQETKDPISLSTSNQSEVSTAL